VVALSSYEAENISTH